jgi:DNA repair exonuclease SbcCD ATPase subunit
VPSPPTPSPNPQTASYQEPKDKSPSPHTTTYQEQTVESPSPPAASYQEPKEKSPSPPAAPNQEPKVESLFSAKLKDKLSDEQAELDKHTKASAALKADLAAAEKTEKEIDQLIGAYEQALQKLRKDKDTADEYVSFKFKKAEAAVGKNKDAIEDIIRQDIDDTSSRQKKVDGQTQDIKQAESDYRKAAEELATAKKAFDKKKSYPTEQAANLKAIQELIAKAEKEDPARPAGIYVLTREISELNKVTDLKASKDFGKDLRQAFYDFNRATDNFREKKQAFDAKGIDLDKDQKALSEREGKRLDRILSAISPYDDEESSNTMA